MRHTWFVLSAATVGLLLGVASPKALADESTKEADAKQEQEIQTELQSSASLKNNHIDVTVDDGIAVLEGTVDSTKEKKEATNRAHVDGILGVNNRLKVRPSAK